MEKKDLRIVYMGTPEFAVESLKRLVEGGYQVVGVITMPDKPMAWQCASAEPGETVCRVARIEGASTRKAEG